MRGEGSCRGHGRSFGAGLRGTESEPSVPERDTRLRTGFGTIRDLRSSVAASDCLGEVSANPFQRRLPQTHGCSSLRRIVGIERGGHKKEEQNWTAPAVKACLGSHTWKGWRTPSSSFPSGKGALPVVEGLDNAVRINVQRHAGASRRRRATERTPGSGEREWEVALRPA